jgi:hypothetical protein
LARSGFRSTGCHVFFNAFTIFHLPAQVYLRSAKESNKMDNPMIRQPLSGSTGRSSNRDTGSVISSSGNDERGMMSYTIRAL